MAVTFEFSHLFRRPEYPVIVDLDERVIAAKSPKDLATKLARLRLPRDRKYASVDSTGENWDLFTYADEATLSPLALKKRWTKIEVVHLYNRRKNRTQDEGPYSEKSLSSKRLDRIIGEIAALLLKAE